MHLYAYKPTQGDSIFISEEKTDLMIIYKRLNRAGGTPGD